MTNIFNLYFKNITQINGIIMVFLFYSQVMYIAFYGESIKIPTTI